MKSRINSKGFTLIEIMVVVALIAIMTTLAIPSFRGMAQRLRTKSAGREIAMDLALARAKAISSGGNQDVSFVAVNNACPNNSGSWMSSGGKMKCLSDNYSGVSFQYTDADPFKFKDSAGADNDTATFKNNGSLDNNLSTLVPPDLGMIYLGDARGNQIKIAVRQYTGLAKMSDGW